MAVPEQTPYKEYTANGSTTSFTLGFICDSKNDLIVLVDNVAPPVATWSLTGGNVVFTTAPAAGKKITLQRNTPFSRTTNYQSNNNSFRPETINKDIDRVWLKLQELGVADYLLRLYVDLLHNNQKAYIDQQDKVLRDNLNNLSEQVELKDNELQQNINNLESYVDDQDNELRSYLMGEISKQGVALDQLDEYYNYLMERLSQIAVDKGWDASFVVDSSGKTQQQVNDSIDLKLESVADLRLTSGKYIGHLAQTLGYYSENDGGGATYKWVGGTEDNGFNKINGWELIFTGEIDVRCGGAIVNPSTVAAQTTEINLVLEQVSLMGGGVVNFPAGVFYASVRSQPNVEVRGRINIDMTPATKIQAWAAITGNENTNLLVNKPNFKAKNLELDGTVNGLPGGITGIRTTVRDCEFENIVSHSHRYDGLVVAMGSGNLRFTKCVFKHTKRNILSIGGGDGIKFVDCEFLEDATISGDSLYLIDIEPNDANGIWYDVSFTNCKISRATETVNGAVFFEQKEVNPNRILNLTFNNCQFLGYAYLSPRGLYPIKGLNVINCDFEGTAFSIAGATVHYVESGLIYGNKFKNTSRFNYGVQFYGDVIFENNTFYSDTGLDSRGATFRTNTFVGIPAIKPVDRQSGGIARIIGDTTNGFKLTALRKVNLNNTATFTLTLPTQCSGVLRVRSASSETLNNGTANQDIHFVIKNAQYYYNTVDNMGAVVTSDVIVTTSDLVVTLARAASSSGTYDLSLELYSASKLAVDNCLNSFNA